MVEKVVWKVDFVDEKVENGLELLIVKVELSVDEDGVEVDCSWAVDEEKW